MSSLWFMVAIVATFNHVRALVSGEALWAEVSDELDTWATCLAELAPDATASAEALVLAALGIMTVDASQVRRDRLH